MAAQQSASTVTGKSRMNAERTVVSTHRFVTTPQTTSSRTSRPRSSGSSEVHWKASKRTLSTTRSSGPQPSSSITSASQKPAASPLTPARAGLFLISAAPSSGRPGRYRCLVNTTGTAARRAWATATAALRTAASAPSRPMPMRGNEPSG